MDKPTVFISHIVDESVLARALQAHLQRDFLGLLDVFVREGIELQRPQTGFRSTSGRGGRLRSQLFTTIAASVGRSRTTSDKRNRSDVGGSTRRLIHCQERPAASRHGWRFGERGARSPSRRSGCRIRLVRLTRKACTAQVATGPGGSPASIAVILWPDFRLGSSANSKMRSMAFTRQADRGVCR